MFNYPNVRTRFLRSDEKLIDSDEQEMPLVIEAMEATDLPFLHHLLRNHSSNIMQDIATYGAILLRGFDINTEADFEKTVCSIPEIKGINEAFMSEEGRIPVDNLQYVLHTNAVYKTGGTLYLGGFHSENYYSTDVPAYISFCCFKPSTLGGETGLINMEKIYSELDPSLKEKLEQNPFFAGKWLVSEVSERYQISTESIVKICQHFDLPILGEGDGQFILMYKPAVFEHPVTGKKSLQINLFEIKTLNAAMRQHFLKDYPGKTWFWHRFVWKLPDAVLKIPEFLYITTASFFYSPKNAINILKTKIRIWKASKKLPTFNKTRVGDCLDDQHVADLARLIRKNYVSTLWQKGDILLVDNRKVMHAGMPGSGQRLVRAMIANPLEMHYSINQSGKIPCAERSFETVGFYMATGQKPTEHTCSSNLCT